MRRPVSASNPLFLIHPPLEGFEELWEKLPPTVRPFCGLAVHACRYDGPENERKLWDTLARATAIDVPVWVYVLDSILQTSFPPEIHERILADFPILKDLLAT